MRVRCRVGTCLAARSNLRFASQLGLSGMHILHGHCKATCCETNLASATLLQPPMVCWSGYVHVSVHLYLAAASKSSARKGKVQGTALS